MIPTVDIITDEITEVEYPTRTIKIEPMEDTNRLNGFVDGLDAIQQAISLILSTERYEYLIYSWDYGIELVDLIGQPMPFVMAELPRRITEALTQDDRIIDVTNFEFEKHGKKLHTTFTVVTNIGEIATSLEVSV